MMDARNETAELGGFVDLGCPGNVHWLIAITPRACTFDMRSRCTGEPV